MSGHVSKYLSPEIKRSSFEDKFFGVEVLLEHHSLVWILSGETKIVQADKTYIFNGGDTILFPRNQLAMFINYPRDGQPFQSVVMNLTTERLKDYYSRNKPTGNQFSLPAIVTLGRHPLLENCLSSMMSYLDFDKELPANLVTLKIEEAISVLRIVDTRIDDLLANFEKPGKADLVAFMEHNYMYNMTLDKFSYLTGRSLTAFKQDFKHAFQTTPQKWLTQKRLGLAHYQLAEKRRKPVDVYLEVGFENLSHFSYAFKKHFGYAPTELTSDRRPSR
jgi:AraC-like DNA-binding protein